MSEQKTHREIAADIIIAMIPQIYGTSDDRRLQRFSEQVAEAYKTIYAAVQNPASD